VDTLDRAGGADQDIYLVSEVPHGCFLARIATLRAIHRREARIFNPDRKDLHRGKRKLKRDQC
jgi:hypothetical protein